MVHSIQSSLSRDTETEGLVVKEGYCKQDSIGLKSRSSDSHSSEADNEDPVSSGRVAAESASCLPPSSPFGEPGMQVDTSRATATNDEAARLDGVGLPDSLLSGLSSLSHNDFKLYMQLTEELSKELEHLDFEDNDRNLSVKDSQQSSGTIHDDQHLQNAIRKLETILPKSAIQNLQSYASYGLLDVMYATPSERREDNTKCGARNIEH